ncbi:ATP-binding cassette domain-containing protein [Lacticaseibacillus sharpeae]|uniref:Uncharacterized protein n=1 Tax=Lacticaseibacillus sharpeae JCM 1186 = DSM 20505 TaxID=1291052 RepID=A0A0R1ZUG3_9LACO|nr:ABC transporter ATP-binding protein [Lacticaseibacillus sharpeae]KRM54380.1 hypothetical protein FC18_GL000601 [Lacticaseibacillus sharpeae JCM 1186 = DSM 20505]
MFKYLMTKPRKFWGVITLMVVDGLALTCWSFLYQLIVDTAMGKGNWQFGTLALFISGYIIVMDLIFVADMYLRKSLLFEAVANVRKQIVATTARLSPAEFGRVGVGGIIAKLTKQLDKVETEYFREWMMVISRAFTGTFALIGTLMLNPLVTLIALLLCIPTLVLPLVTKKAIGRASAAQVAQIERYTNRITDLLSGFTTLKYALMPGTLITQHAQANTALLQTQRKNEQINQIANGLSIFFNDIMTVMIWVVGAILVQKQMMGMGQLVAFANLTNFMTWPLTELTQSIPAIISGKKAGEIILEFIDSPRAEEGGVPAPAGPITFTTRDLGLTIDDHEILRDVNLELTQAKKYLLVGASGGGKSTLVRLLLGEMAPTTGTATLLDVPAADLARDAVYGRVGLLAQRGYVFAGTVRENMTLFADGYADGAITAAMARAGLTEWLAQHSLEIKISEAGGELSGGEKQRLALARLFLRGYDFYIFDELTTGLDPQIADQLLRDLGAMPQGFLMITHTYNHDAFLAADEILVVKDGQLATRGQLADPAVQQELHALAMI